MTLFKSNNFVRKLMFIDSYFVVQQIRYRILQLKKNFSLQFFLRYLILKQQSRSLPIYRPVIVTILKSLNVLIRQILFSFYTLFNIIKSYIRLFISYLTSNDFQSIIKRTFISISLFSFPFFLLLKHSLIPGISVFTALEHEKYSTTLLLVVNQFLLRLIGKIPYFLNIVEYVLPVVLSDNMPNIQFALLYSYFLIFAANHRALRIPYEIAYHGTVAFAFLTFQYALNLIQDFIIYPFDLYLGFPQSFAQIAFEAKIGFPIDQMFVDLNNDILLIDLLRVIQRYEFHKTMIAKFIISPVAFVALCALVYNCSYYVLKKKNPRILFISNTVSRVMTDGKDDLL